MKIQRESLKEKILKAQRKGKERRKSKEFKNFENDSKFTAKIKEKSEIK